MPEILSALSPPPGTDTPVGTQGSSPGPFRNLLRDSLWQVAGGVSASLVNVGMYMVAVRLLGREQFGAFGLVHTAAVFCTSFLGFGARNTLMILAGRSRYDKKDTVVGSCYVYLAATAMDLGCCGIGAFYDREAREALGLNRGSRLLYLVAVGPVKRV